MERTGWRRYVEAAVAAGAVEQDRHEGQLGQDGPDHGPRSAREILGTSFENLVGNRGRERRAARRRAGNQERLPPEEPRALRDLRLVPAAVASWAAAMTAVRLGPAGAFVLSAVLAAAAVLLLAFGPRWRAGKDFGGRDQRPVSRRFGRRRQAAAAKPVPRPGWVMHLIVPAAAAALVACSAATVLTARSTGPFNDAVAAQSTVTAELTAVTDARKAGRPDRFTGEPNYLVEATVRSATSGGERFTASARVLIVGGPEWGRVRLGDAVSAAGKLAPTEPGDKAAALFLAAAVPRTVPAGGWQRFTADLRDRFAGAVSGNDDVKGLLPGMVLGDRSRLPADLEAAMKDTGLTHLTAVSGANCAYILGFVFLLARSLKCPRIPAAAAATAVLAGFVLLVRPDPSVLRAAVMGTIGVVAVLTGRGKMSFALLGAAVVILLAADPWLAGSFAFILSVLATTGLVLLGNPCARWLGTWLHPAAAAALAMPIAAQALCAPILILLQPAVASYSVPANVVAAPVVPIVTIVGMAGICVLGVVPPAASILIAAAGAGAQWLAGTARFFAGLPGAALPWPAGPAGAVLMAASSAAAIAGLWVLAMHGSRAWAGLRAVTGWALPLAGRPMPAAADSQAQAAATSRARVPADRRSRTRPKNARGSGRRHFLPPLFRPVGRIHGWVLLVLAGLLAGGLAGRAATSPAVHRQDWDIAACDVGQGDAFVLRSGQRSGIVIDTGPDPGVADACLERLDIVRIDLLVLTHLHQDHTGGFPGAAEGRSIGRILYASADEAVPPQVAQAAVANGIAAERAAAGMSGSSGQVRWRILWPAAVSPASRGSSENNSSVVMEVTLPLEAPAGEGGASMPQDPGVRNNGATSGRAPTHYRALFTGDLESEAAARLLQRSAELSAGHIAVLKVAHHGARNGGGEMIRSLRPAVALISAGRGNDYGHPHAETLQVLEEAGTTVARTDLHGLTTINGSADGLVITTDRGKVDQWGGRHRPPSDVPGDPAP